MKITAEVIIRETKYVIESVDGANDIKQAIAELENPEVVIKPSTVTIKHNS